MAGEPNAGFFAPAIETLDELVMPSISLYEVFKRILLELGEDQALDAAGIMSLGQIVELDRQIAIEAAQLSVETKLAMADSIILATAA